MLTYATGCLSLLLTALSLGPSFAHALESPPRLNVRSRELWRETTVFNGQFEFFLKVGAPLDVAAILIAAYVAYLLSAERPAFWFAATGACLLALALAAWFSMVAPANAVLATWKPGPIPADFDAIRSRWETGHMVVAALKILGFVALCGALVAPRLNSGTP